MNLLPLDDYNRKASLGLDYPVLKRIYPKWSRDLHVEGNFINNDKLKIISINGLIQWYFNKLSHFNIDYNYISIKEFIETPRDISFYEIKAIIKLGEYFNIKNDYISKLELEKYEYKHKYLFLNYKYSMIEKNIRNMKIVNKYCCCKFGNYLVDNMGEENIKMYLTDIYTEYLKYQEFFDGKTLFDNFIEKYPKIIDWGVIYHKFKVILEKISRNNHKDIYKVDSFVEKIQQYIYTLIAKHFENIMLNHNIDIYIKDEEDLYNDKYFHSFPDEILKDFDFDNIIYI